MTNRQPTHRITFLLAGVLAASLGVTEVVAQPLERARAAQGRGDLRAAQIEYRNAVRAEPRNGAVRLGLGLVSLELGDLETAEREARAALETGQEAEAATALLVRTYLVRGRHRELLRELPMPENPSQPRAAGQIAAGRAMAELALGERDAARLSLNAAQRLAPDAVETRIAAASLAGAAGNRAEMEAEIDRALASHPQSPEALMRKAALLLDAGRGTEAMETLGRLITHSPGSVQGRLMRAELLLRTGDIARARQDAEAALRVNPGSAQAVFLIASVQARQGEWRAADESLQRMARILPNLPDGLLLLATVKRALGERAQAEDAAQRHVARRPEDPRGAKLLAALLMETERPAEAAALLVRFSERFGGDAELVDLLGRAQVSAGRPREAVSAFRRAAELSPEDSGIRARLAAAQLAAGDAAGTMQAAEESLRISPGQSGARELLALAAIARGDITTAQAEWERLDPNQRRGEAGGTLEGLLALARFDLAGARTAFETVIRNHPESIGARVGLARALTAQGNPAEAEQLLGEVLRRSPNHPEALGRLAATIGRGGARAAAARAVLEEVQAAAPAESNLALALASALAAAGDPARALVILNSEALRRPGQGPALPLARSQIHATLQQWAEAEQAARLALAEDATSFAARRQLVALLLRGGDTRNAQALLQEGLRGQPGNTSLLQLSVVLAQQAGGIDAALAMADRLAANTASRPASLLLRGDILLNAGRPAEAARAFAAAHAIAPSSELAVHEAAAWQAAGQTASAITALNAWLAREPGDAGALNMMAQFDIAAGRGAEAERRLAMVVERLPDNAVALNNLAWLMAERGGEAELVRARRMAERAYFLLPNPDTADTFGWVLARSGETQRALVLLRQAVAGPRPEGQVADPGKVFRLAHTMHAAGQREEALRTLEPVLARGAVFPQRVEAERLLADLRAGR